MINALDFVVVILILGTVPAANIFPMLYLLTTRWNADLPARALLVKSLSTMLLIDLALLVRGDRLVESFNIPDIVLAVFRTLVMFLIFLGVNLMTIALVREKLPRLRERLREHRAT